MMKRSQLARPGRQLMFCATAVLAITGSLFAQSANSGAKAASTTDEGGYSSWEITPYIGAQWFQVYQHHNAPNYVDRYGPGWLFGERFTFHVDPKISIEGSMNIGSNRLYLQPFGQQGYASIKTHNMQIAFDLLYNFQPRTAATRFFILAGPAAELYAPNGTNGPSAVGTFVQPLFPLHKKVEPAITYGVGMTHYFNQSYGIRVDLDGRFGPKAHYNLPAGPLGLNTLYLPNRGTASSISANVGLVLREHYIAPPPPPMPAPVSQSIRVDIAAAAGSAPTISGAHDVCPGDDLRLTANAAGFPNPTYQWRVDGSAASGATAAAFSAPTATGTGARAATVVVGGGTTVATSAPFTTAPMHTYHLTAEAPGVGNRTASYQWMAGGQPIAGATSATLDLPNDAAKSITVRVTVQNAAVTSAPANYTIRALTPPTLTFAVNPTSVPYTNGPIALTSTSGASQCGGAVTVRYSGEGVTGSSFNPGSVSGFDMANRLRQQTKTVTITATATDAKGQTVSRTANVTVTLSPEARRLDDVVFQNLSARVNNCGKRLLVEELTPMLRNDPGAHVILIGHRDEKTEKGSKKLDETRVLNSAAVLSAGKGVCPQLDLSRIMTKTVGTDQASTPRPAMCGSSTNVKEKSGQAVKESDKNAQFRRVEVWIVPSGASDPAGVSGLTALDSKAVTKLGCPK